MKMLKFALLLCVGLFFVSACVGIQKPTKHSKSSQNTLAQKNALHNFTDAYHFNTLKNNFQKKDVHIRIFGDSHMAADFFSSRLRHYIKTQSIGFVYPLQPKYHQIVPLQYKSQHFEIMNSKSAGAKDYPMGGIIAKSLKEGAFIILESIKNSDFSLGILFQSPNTKDALIITDMNNKNFILKSPTANQWSYAQIHKLKFPLKISALDKNVLLGGYFIINENQSAILDTLGINGAKSDLWLRWDSAMFLEELNLLKSDIIILAYGSNDALMGAFDEKVFKENYKKFIQMFYASNPNTSIILIAPPTVTQKIADDYELAKDFYRVQKAIYELAKEEKLLLFDMHQFIQNNGGKELWIEQNLSLKDVHLTPDGYKLMADEFYFTLFKTLGIKPTYSLAN